MRLQFQQLVTAASLTKPSLKISKGRLVDRIRVYVRGGGGGQGCLRYGGIGGRGGDVVVRAHAHRTSLADIARSERQRFIASSGKNTKFNSKIGKQGKNEIVEVPVGTVVYDATGIVIGDLDADGSQVTVAVGGEGGSAMTENNSGTKGERKIITLELKTIADVGLVGFPNAGKSTLLRALSSADPKIADYPFTTVRPQVGVLQYEKSDFRLVLADIPGLVEGASENKGMGHRFLRHIERTRLLLFVVDVNGFQLKSSHPFRSVMETVEILKKELELHSKELAFCPRILAVNKMDTDGSKEVFGYLKTALDDRTVTGVETPRFHGIIGISAKRQQGLKELKDLLRQFFLSKRKQNK